MKMSKTADYQARDQAINTQQSILLQAPAGSGKTELLSQRILALLAIVNQPEEILALTFTNKAANEMQQRVLKHLQAADNSVDDNLKPHEKLSYDLAKSALLNSKEKNWNLLDSPNRLQIKTIDSLNAGLIQQMPILSKTGSLEAVTTDTNKIYQQAVQETMLELEENSDNSAALFTLLKHFENNSTTIEDLLIKMLGKRDQWLRLGINFNVDMVQLKEILEQNWLSLAEKHLIQFEEYILVQLIEFQKYSDLHLELPEITTEFGADIDNSFEYIRRWHKMLFTNDNKLRAKVTKNVGFPVDSPDQKIIKKKFIDFLQTIDTNLLQAIQSAVLVPPIKFSNSQWQMLDSLLQVLNLCLANLQLQFIKTSQLDFNEVNILARNALGNLDEPSDLALYLDHQISHVLVDEFQDTNHLQFELLERLTTSWNENDGQTFFIVGDPMQSIYKFREADVGLFQKAKQHGIGNIKFNYLELSVNFRSSTQVIDWCNSRFKTIFPTKSNQYTGAVTHTKSEVHLTELHGGVHFQGFKTKDKTYEAFAVVETIESIISQHPQDSIGILLRKKTDLNQIAKLLKQKNIQFKATEMDLLSDLQVVDDIKNLTMAIMNLGDRSAWLAVLRAPWCGLKLSDLQIIVDAGQNHKEILFVLMQKPNLNLSIEAQARLDFIVNVFQQAFSSKLIFPLSILVKKTWESLQGHKLITSESEKIAIEMVLDIIDKLSLEPSFDLNTFTTEIDKLYAPILTNKDIKIECMTIHKSKGLEFDHVLIPYLNTAPKPNNSEIMQWTQTTGGLLLAPIKATCADSDPKYDYLTSLNSTKEKFESMRVLYVAATRAVKNLYLYATLNPKKSGDSLPLKNSMLNFLWSHEKDNFIDIEDNTNTTDNNLNTPVTISRINEVPKDDQLLTAEYKLINYTLTTDIDAAAITGTVFHLCCEQLSQMPLDAINTTNDLPNIKHFIASNLARHGLEEYSSAQTYIIKLLNNMLSHPQGRWILDIKHQDSQQELKLQQQNSTINNFIIDRCFIDNEVFWIIDYKTSKPNKNESTDEFIKRMTADHKEQLMNYAKMIKPLHKLPIKIMLCLPSNNLYIEI